MGLHDKFRDARREMQERPVAVEVAVTDDVENVSDYVRVKEVGGNEFFHPDCRWSARRNLDGSQRFPERGDTGLLIVSDRANPWLVEWWPYG